MPIVINGADEILDELEKVKNFKTLVPAMEKVSAIVERSAKENAPKATGALRRSIESEVSGNRKSVVAKVFTPLEYAHYVEYGTGLFAEGGNGRATPWSYQDEAGNWHTTSGMKPAPFLRPALEENQKRIIDTIKEGIVL